MREGMQRWLHFLSLSRVVAVKEFIEIFRDLRALLLLVALPAFLYPLLMFGMARAGAASMASLEERTVTVGYHADIPKELQEKLAATDKFVVVALDEAPDPQQEEKNVDVALQLDNGKTKESDDTQANQKAIPSIQLALDRSRDSSNVAEDRIRDVVADFVDKEHAAYLTAKGVEPAYFAPRAITVKDTATAEQRSGSLFGRLFAPLAIVILLAGAFYPATEVTAGERERHTLLTLLCAPVPPTAIALGKLLAVASVGLLAVFANLFSLAITGQVGIFEQLSFAPHPMLFLGAVVLLPPLAIAVSAVFMATAALSKSPREAQTLLTPVMLVVMIPAMIAALPGMEATVINALIPIFGPALVLREMCRGSVDFSLLASAFAGLLALCIVAIGITARAFTIEALATGKVQPPLRRAGPLPLFDSVLLTMAVGSGMLLIGLAIRNMPLVQGLLVSQAVVFAGLPILFVVLRSTTPLDALGIHLPARAGWLAALLGVGSVPIFAAITSRIAQQLLDVNPAQTAQLEELSKQLLAVPPALLFIAIAVVPPICEEICFRGALLRSWGQRPVIAIVVQALIFAGMHGAVVRLAPTLVVGALAGYVSLRSKSLWPAIVVHMMHNGLAFVLSLQSLDDQDPNKSAALVDLDASLDLAAQMPLALLIGSGICAVLLLVEGVRAWQQSRARG